MQYLCTEVAQFLVFSRREIISKACPREKESTKRNDSKNGAKGHIVFSEVRGFS